MGIACMRPGSDMDDMDPKIFGIRRWFLIAGVAGIILGIVRRREFNWPAAITSTIAGACCVLWAAPAAIEIVGEFVVVKDGVQGLIFWAFGMSGMLLVDFVIKAFGDPWAAFDRWRGRGGRP